MDQKEWCAAFEDVPFGVQLYALDGTSLWMNEAQRAQLGVPSRETGVGVFNALTDPWSVGVGAAALFRRALEGHVADATEPEVDLGRATPIWGTRSELRFVRYRFVPVRGAEGTPTAIALFAWDLTDLARAQDESEAHFRGLLRCSKDPVAVLGASGALEYVNEAHEQLFGYSWAERRASPQQTRELLADDTSRAWFDRFWAARSERDGWPEEDAVLTWRLRDGRVATVEHRFSNLRASDGRILGLLDVGRDVTGRRHAEAALRRAHDRIEAAARAAGISFFEESLDAGTIAVEPSLVERFRLEGALDYEAVLSRIHPDDRPGVEAHRARVELGETPVGPIDYRAEDGGGDWRWFRSYVARGARERVLLGTIQDVTALRRMEEELAEARKRAALGRAAAGIAHDFQNLLQVILTAAQTLADPSARAGNVAIGTVADIVDAANAAASLARKLAAGTHEPAPQWTGLDALVHHHGPVLSMLAPQCRVELSLDAPGLEILADTTQFEQILMNLVVNARDAKPASGVIRVATRRAPDREPPEGQLVVSDDGIGMSPEVLARARQPYFTTKPAGRGTGLGLSIVEAAATAHGATLEIESRSGAGSTFTLRFPARDAAASSAARVLVAALDPVARRTTGRVLRKRYPVEELATLEEAGERAFDLVVLHGTETLPRAMAARAPAVLRVLDDAASSTGSTDHAELVGPWTQDQLFEAAALALAARRTGPR